MSEDLNAVISGAIEDAGDVGGGDGGGADAGSDAGGDVAAAVDTTQQAAAATDPLVNEPDAFAKENGYSSKRPDGRENRLPHSRVVKISQNAVKKEIARVAKELGLDKADVSTEDVIASLTERKTKFTEYEQKAAHAELVDKLMSGDGDEFIRQLAQASPERYSKFAKVLEAVQEQQQQQQTRTDEDAEPQPDFDLGDGQMTYSMAGLAKLREWDRRQAAKEAAKHFDSRLKPIEDERQAAAKAKKERDDAEALMKDVDSKVSRTLDRMKKRQGFEENKEAILKAMQEHKIDVEDAYYHVMMPTWTQNRSSQRDEILKELKAAPSDTATNGKTQAPVASDGPKTIEEIIAASVAGLKRK